MRRAQSGDLRAPSWVLPAALTASVAAAVAIGDTVVVSPRGAVVGAYVVAVLASVAYGGLLGLALLSAATLPWLVIVGSFLPRLTETLAAGGVLILVLLVTVPQRKERSRASFLLRLGVVCFYAPVVLSLGTNGSREQLIQAAKYVVFPLAVLAVTEATNIRNLTLLRSVVLWSSMAAVATNLLLGLVGVGNLSTYDAGAIVGLGSEHDLALLAGCLAAVCLTAGSSLKWSAGVAVAAVATVATGVRSALPGLAILAIAKMVTAGARVRTIVLVGLAVVAVFASGAAQVVENRYHTGESRGEFNSFNTIGSGRGEIWTAAIDGWRASSPEKWLVGTGLRSIQGFEQKKLGYPFGGHSDVVDVGVQLGLVGLLGLVLIWSALVAGAQSRAPLLVLASFAIFNGDLEYSASILIAVLLAAGAFVHTDGVAVGSLARNPRRPIRPRAI